MNGTKVLYCLMYLILAIMFSTMLLIFYWLWFPYKTVVFQDPMFPVINKQVKQGSILYYTSRYCKYFNASATIAGTFENGLIYTLPSTETNREMGCHTIPIGILVPPELPPSTYVFKRIYKIEVNPIRNITIEHQTEPFTVLEATPSGR